MSHNNKIAAIRIRGLVNVDGRIKDTLSMLRLEQKNACVVVDDTPSMRGMINKAKDYITWGEIEEKTLKMLLEKRFKKTENDEKKKITLFRLSPPKGGFERKGIKVSFSAGGVLGDRGKDINSLIEKMI